jgi:hypothetical protein
MFQKGIIICSFLNGDKRCFANVFYNNSCTKQQILQAWQRIKLLDVPTDLTYGGWSCAQFVKLCPPDSFWIGERITPVPEVAEHYIVVTFKDKTAHLECTTKYGTESPEPEIIIPRPELSDLIEVLGMRTT